MSGSSKSRPKSTKTLAEGDGTRHNRKGSEIGKKDDLIGHLLRTAFSERGPSVHISTADPTPGHKDDKDDNETRESEKLRLIDEFSHEFAHCCITANKAINNDDRDDLAPDHLQKMIKEYIQKDFPGADELKQRLTSIIPDRDVIRQRLASVMPDRKQLSERYDYAPSPGKGGGLFARRSIRKGERIIKEYPLILESATEGTNNGYGLQWTALTASDFICITDLATVWNRARKQLGRETWSTSDSPLADWPMITALDALIAESIDQGEAKPTTLNVTDMNAQLGMLQFYDCNRMLLPSSTHFFCTGLFHHASTINHACNPNAVRGFDSENRHLTVHACRDIPKGEEITIDYVWALDPTPVGQARCVSRSSLMNRRPKNAANGY